MWLAGTFWEGMANTSLGHFDRAQQQESHRLVQEQVGLSVEGKDGLEPFPLRDPSHCASRGEFHKFDLAQLR